MELNLEIGPYIISQRTEYSRIKLFNIKTTEYVEDEESLKEILNDYYKQSKNPDKYFEIQDDTKLIRTKNKFYEEKIKYTFIPEGITEIGENAFRNNLFKFVHFPDTLQKIGKGAFMSCTQLDYVNIPDSVTSIRGLAFRDCTSLTEIKLPNVDEIISETFYGCHSLKSIYIPDSVKTIKTFVFGKCENLENIRLSKNLETLGAYAFSECSSLNKINLPDSLTYIGEGSFVSSGIKSIEIPDSVTVIEENIFKSCRKLEAVKLSNNINTLSAGIFVGCVKLKDMVLPDNICTLNDGAFSSTSNLKNINIPKKLNTIGNYPFIYSNITTLTFNHSLKSLIKIGIDYGNEYNSFGMSKIKKLVIDNSVEIITHYILKECEWKHVNEIEYLGSKEEFNKFKENNKLLFDKYLTNIEKIHFVEKNPINLEIDNCQR